MSTDTLNATDFHLDTNGAKPPKPPKMVTVRLLRNYQPKSDDYEILGYHKEPIIRKRPDGKLVTVEPGGFITELDENGNVIPAPPAMPGTGFAGRLNAGTQVRLPVEEARRVRAEKIGEYEIDD